MGLGQKYPKIERKGPLSWGRALGRGVLRVDRRWNMHVAVGIPPPPSRCPIHPTQLLPLLYLPLNNLKLPRTRFLPSI